MNRWPQRRQRRASAASSAPHSGQAIVLAGGSLASPRRSRTLATLCSQSVTSRSASARRVSSADAAIARASSRVCSSVSRSPACSASEAALKSSTSRCRERFPESVSATIEEAFVHVHRLSCPPTHSPSEHPPRRMRGENHGELRRRGTGTGASCGSSFSVINGRAAAGAAGAAAARGSPAARRSRSPSWSRLAGRVLRGLCRRQGRALCSAGEGAGAGRPSERAGYRPTGPSSGEDGPRSGAPAKNRSIPATSRGRESRKPWPRSHCSRCRPRS